MRTAQLLLLLIPATTSLYEEPPGGCQGPPDDDPMFMQPQRPRQVPRPPPRPRPPPPPPPPPEPKSQEDLERELYERESAAQLAGLGAEEANEDWEAIEREQLRGQRSRELIQLFAIIVALAFSAYKVYAHFAEQHAEPPAKGMAAAPAVAAPEASEITKECKKNEAEELKAKQAAEAKTTKEKEELVRGGSGTADDALDASSSGADGASDVAPADASGSAQGVVYADALKLHIAAALSEVLTNQPDDPFKAMQKVLFQASLSDKDPASSAPIHTPEAKAYMAKFDLQTHIDAVIAKKASGSGPKSGVKFLVSDAGDYFTELSTKLKAAGGVAMSAEELKAMDAAAAKAKREKEAKAEAERDAQDAINAEKTKAMEAQGKKVSGGLFKFDAEEVDVHGGSGTADDFLDAFGF